MRLIGLLIVCGLAACGGESTTAPPAGTVTTAPSPTAAPTTDPPATHAPSTSLPDTTSPPDPTSAPATSGAPAGSTPATPVPEPDIADAVLRPDGVGGLDFGTPAEEALPELVQWLGTPTSDVPILPDADCVEGASWLDCVKGLRIIEEGRLLTWSDIGLEIAFVDSDGLVPGRVPAPLQFADWQATVTGGEDRLETADGLSPGMTIGQLRLTVPAVEFGYGEGLLDGYFVEVPTGGGYYGLLDWDPDTTEIEHADIRAVQTALNEAGATLSVDGVWGPRTQAAWTAILQELDVDVVTQQLWLTPEVGEALGLPPDDITIATIEPRDN